MRTNTTRALREQTPLLVTERCQFTDMSLFRSHFLTSQRGEEMEVAISLEAVMKNETVTLNGLLEAPG